MKNRVRSTLSKKALIIFFKTAVRRRILFVGIAGVVIALAVLIVFLSFYTPSNTFILREDGWHPQEIIVSPGEVVTFVNTSKNAFWPASNNHPAHDGYPEFDAGRPIMPGQSWTFTFARSGKWGFHDHLRSFYTGVVVVGSDFVNYDCLKDLAQENIPAKRTCWSDLLLKELQDRGTASAFQLFARFYHADSDFAKVGCHSMAHQIGDFAYGEYIRSGKNVSKLQFPPESVYCGYGYYHGVLEHMIRDNPDYRKAEAFCKDLVRTYEKTVPRIRLNCYHAIGHGFVPVPNDPERWGRPLEVAEPAFSACVNIEAVDARTECFQGVFNVLGDWMWNNEFGLGFSAEDPLALCKSAQGSEVQNACYYELAMKLLPLVGDDLQAVYEKFAAPIPDDVIASMVMNSAAASIVGNHITDQSFIPFLQTCRSLPERVRTNCLIGIAGAFIAYGEPEQEHVKALAFCGDVELTVEEKDVCYQNILRTFKGVYTQEKVLALCENIAPAYRMYCEYD